MARTHWHDRWDEGRIGFHEEKPNAALQGFVERLGSGTVFVPLAGKSQDILFLRDHGFDVVAVELVPKAVEEFFAENRLPVEKSSTPHHTLYETDRLHFYCGDVFELGATELSATTAVYDRAALIALPPEARKKYAQLVQAKCNALQDMLLVTLEYDQAEMRGPPFSVLPAEVEDLYENANQIESLERSNIWEDSKFKDRLTSLASATYHLRF